MARASKPYRPRRMHDPDKLQRQLAGWASAPFVQEQRQAHARDLAQKAAAERQQQELNRTRESFEHARRVAAHREALDRLSRLQALLLSNEE